MVYIDENGEVLESVDLSLGRLEDVEVAEYPEIKEVGHYEYDDLEGGGRLQRYVIDVPYRPPRSEVVKQRYIPYTAEELEAIAKRDYGARLNVLEEQTQAHGEMLTAIEEGIANA